MEISQLMILQRAKRPHEILVIRSEVLKIWQVGQRGVMRVVVNLYILISIYMDQRMIGLGKYVTVKVRDYALSHFYAYIGIRLIEMHDMSIIVINRMDQSDEQNMHRESH